MNFYKIKGLNSILCFSSCDDMCTFHNVKSACFSQIYEMSVNCMLLSGFYMTYIHCLYNTEGAQLMFYLLQSVS